MAIGAHIAGENPEKEMLFLALQEVALSHSDQKITLFTNGPINDLPQNCIQVNISPKPQNKLFLYYWYSYKLPRLLVKYNIHSFISNAVVLPKINTVKRFIFIENDLFFKKKLGDIFSAAQTVFVTDEFLKMQLCHTFKNLVIKTETLHLTLANGNRNFTLTELENAKEKFTQGFDYYLFLVNTSSKVHALTVLKSFSQLKKWQKTSLKLVLLFENEIDEKLLPDFKNYKYKNDVVLLKQTAENKELLIAAAFTMVFLGNYKNRLSVYDAFHYNIPVIAADTETNNVLFNAAVIYAAPTVENLALQLQLLYKNEIYKNQLIQKATTFLTKFNSSKASQTLYDIVSN